MDQIGHHGTQHHQRRGQDKLQDLTDRYTRELDQIGAALGFGGSSDGSHPSLSTPELRQVSVDRAPRVALLGLVAVLGLTSAAAADPITVVFTVFPAAGDPVNFTSSTGTFTFDSGLFPLCIGTFQS